MTLRVMTPVEIMVEREVVKVSAEGGAGAFTLLPRHVDFVSDIVPGILVHVDVRGEERYVAVDEGVLVKVGGEVLVSVRHGATGPDLGSLRTAVEERFLEVEDREKASRSALAKLEADFVRRFMELR